ncbi:MAG TPA: hypothetical protein VFX79_01800 [Candidatus Saccharimonadales bacterium]|nr:hypothetical protein [Candidatus Saccharimonadales bacterium]
MDETLILGIAVLALWALVVYLRIPTTVLFLSILIGKLFAEELSLDAYEVVSGVLPGITTTAVQAGLLILPVVLTIVFLKGSTLKSSMLFNAVPLFFCLVTLGLFINPYFDVVSRLDEEQRIILTDNQSYVVAVAGLVTLLSSWLSRGRSLSGHRRHKRKNN